MAEENLIRTAETSNEGETVLVELTFRDIDGVGVVPPTGFWTLYNLADETIINNRSAVGMTPSASTYTIELSGSDNALIDECLFVEEHRFYFEYRHGDGGARTSNGEVQILVQNMHKK